MISDANFQKALRTARDDHLFAHVPVDWWDADAGVWRPSVIESRVAGARSERTHAAIVAPGPVGRGVTEVNYVAKPVAIGELRPSRLVDEAVAQFFTTRYTLELVDSLMPCIDMASEEERTQLDAVLNDLLEVYASSYSAWLHAFSAGSGDGVAAVAGDGWLEHAVEMASLPRRGLRRPGRVDVFAAIESEQADGAIDCSPVAMWDEEARLWRPTMMLGATGEAEQFGAVARVSVFVPGDPVDVVRVPGSLLQPLDMQDTCFSLIAIPVLARDFLRMHDALGAAGFDAADVVAHPFVIAFAKMLDGAAAEWSELYDEGLPGPEPEPRVTPIDPALWGLSSEDNEVLRDDRVRG